LTPSQKKYLDIILTAWGSWSLFQQLLVTLRKIGDQHHVSIANVATRWVLDHDIVGAVLIGKDPFFGFGPAASSQDLLLMNPYVTPITQVHGWA